jgi:Mg-chelatase subunit ChlD
MMVVAFTYFAWIFFSPINFMFGLSLGSFPTVLVLALDTVVYAPCMYYLIGEWLRRMVRRNTGPAAGIDVVEPGHATLDQGDEWGEATHPYAPATPPKTTGSKSEIRSNPTGLDVGFFMKPPDITSGESLFDSDQLLSHAMMRASVSSGNWRKKRVSSRAMGTLKTSESRQTGRFVRARKPHGEVHMPSLSSTVVAAALRTGSIRQDQTLKIQREDLREKVLVQRTPLTVILVVDVSLSMKGSMTEVRRLFERVEQETRGSRDRIGIVAFKDSGAVEVQTPTSNWNRVYRALARLRISGLTPLADALARSLDTVRRERMRGGNTESLIVIISDFSPNIPLVGSMGIENVTYTPVQDIVRTARLLRAQRVRLAAVNVDPEQAKWSRFLKRSYHDAMELAVLLRTKKDGFGDSIETVLSIPEFRKSFGAFLVAKAGGGRAFLSGELLRERSALASLLSGTETHGKHSWSV